MKKQLLGFGVALAAFSLNAHLAHAIPAGSGSTSTITMNVPPVLTITTTDSTVLVNNPGGSGANGNAIVASVKTNYQNGVNIKVKAGATGARTVSSNVGGTGTIFADDISVGNVSGLTLSDQLLEAVQPPLNTTTPYSYPVSVGGIKFYPTGSYSNTVLFTLTPQ